MEYEISGYIESMKHKYPELLVFLTGGDDFSFDSIDMEKETPIHSITAAFMQVVGAEVFLPETVIISISDDGINFTELQKQHFEVSKETPIRFTDISWQGEAKGRYVRYQAQAGSEFGGWIFTDEIIVK